MLKELSGNKHADVLEFPQLNETFIFHFVERSSHGK